MQKSIAKNAVYSILLRVFNIIVPIVIGAYPIRIFGPDLMGRVAYSESIYNFFMIFATFGIYNYALREISKVRDNAKKTNVNFTNLFVLGVITHIIVSVIYFIYVFLAFRNKPQFIVLLIYGGTMLQDLFYIEWVNEALENFDFITKKAIIVRIINIILLLTLVKDKSDFYIYVFLISFSWILNNIISFIYIKKRIKFDFSSLELSRHIKPLLSILLISNSYLFYTQLDKIMLGANVGDAQVGFYNISQLIVVLINSMLLSIVSVTVPRLSNISETDENKYLQLLERVSKFYFAFMFPAAIGIFVLAKEIIILYGSAQYAPAVPVLRMFSIFLITMGIESILTNQIIYVKRKEKYLAMFLIACGLINITLKVIILKFGMLNPVSAVATTTIANFILITVEYSFIKLYLKVPYNIFDINKLKYLFIALLFIPITYAIRFVLHSIILVTLCSIAVNAGVYLVILLISKDEALGTIIYRLRSRRGK